MTAVQLSASAQPPKLGVAKSEGAGAGLDESSEPPGGTVSFWPNLPRFGTYLVPELSQVWRGPHWQELE